MHGEIISIGDEITSGQLLDTNSQWLSLRLEELGIHVLHHATVGDEVVLYGRQAPQYANTAAGPAPQYGHITAGQGEAEILITEAAEPLGTIPNEIMTALGARVPRRYLSEAGPTTAGAPTR